MKSPFDDSDSDDEFIDNAFIDRLDAAFDDYLEDVLFKSGLDELKSILSSEEFDALERYLVYPIYDLVDFEGERIPSKSFRQSIESTVKIAAYLQRTLKQLAAREVYLERQMTIANRFGYVCAGIIVTLLALIFYFASNEHR